jgi:hypothetical protein
MSKKNRIKNLKKNSEDIDTKVNRLYSETVSKLFHKMTVLNLPITTLRNWSTDQDNKDKILAKSLDGFTPNETELMCIMLKDHHDMPVPPGDLAIAVAKLAMEYGIKFG